MHSPPHKQPLQLPSPASTRATAQAHRSVLQGADGGEGGGRKSTEHAARGGGRQWHRRCTSAGSGLTAHCPAVAYSTRAAELTPGALGPRWAAGAAGPAAAIARAGSRDGPRVLRRWIEGTSKALEPHGPVCMRVARLWPGFWAPARFSTFAGVSRSAAAAGGRSVPASCSTARRRRLHCRRRRLPPLQSARA